MVVAATALVAVAVIVAVTAVAALVAVAVMVAVTAVAFLPVFDDVDP